MEQLSCGAKDLAIVLASSQIGESASRVATQPRLRAVLCEVQRELGQTSSLVVEGRDAGSVVFPTADCKFFLIASTEERAKRRYNQLSPEQRDKTSLDLVHRQIELRDERDKTREHAPALSADDALEIDTSELLEDMVVDKIYEIVKKRISN